MLSTSQVIATRRAPMRSMSGPARAFTTTSGSSSAKATRPVCAADPVVVSTSQGIAIIEMRVPASEMASETRKPTSGLRRLMLALDVTSRRPRARSRERLELEHEVDRVGVVVRVLAAAP